MSRAAGPREPVPRAPAVLRSNRLGFTQHRQAVDHPHAHREDAQRPPWVRAADVQQRLDRAEGSCNDPDSDSDALISIAPTMIVIQPHVWSVENT